MGEYMKNMVERLANPEAFQIVPKTVRFSVTINRDVNRRLSFLSKRFGVSKASLVNDALEAFGADVMVEIYSQFTEKEKHEFHVFLTSDGPFDYEEARVECEGLGLVNE